MAITTINLTGTFLGPDDQPLRGTITLTPSSAFVDTEDALVIAPVPIDVSLDANGSFMQELPISDDEDSNPLDFTWKVREDLRAAGWRRTRIYSIRLPSDLVPDVDLSELDPVGADLGEVTLIQGPTGAKGPTGDTGATGPQGPTRPYQQLNMVGKIDNGYIVPARSASAAVNPGVSVGNMVMTPFIASDALQVNYLTAMSGSAFIVGAPTGVTLCRLGLYHLSGTTWSLVASTASDTTLWNAINTVYKRAVTSPYTLIPGDTYAVGQLRVGGSNATPIATAFTAANGGAPMAQITPALTYVYAASDLPSSIDASSLTAPVSVFYTVLTSA
jgi:hypothetical protein